MAGRDGKGVRREVSVIETLMRRRLLPLALALLGSLILGSTFSYASHSSSLAAPEVPPYDVSVIEAIGVPSELSVPWLLPPRDGHLPGILVADIALLERLQRAGAATRILGEYLERRPYYLVYGSFPVSEKVVSQLGDVLWSSGSSYLVCAGRRAGMGRGAQALGRVEDRAAMLGLRLNRLEIVQRSIESVRPVSAQIFRTASSVEDSCINLMVDAVSESDILDYLNSLTGEQEVFLSGGPDTILSRYSFHPNCLDAAEYIYSQFDSMGLSVEYDDYFGIPLYSIAFEGLEGYAVGRGGSILHTEDGGDSWESQDSGTDEILLKPSFIDADTGWVSGSVGLCIRTIDGGVTWDSLETGTWYYLYGVKFVNALEGWVCGSEGTLRKTSNGGLNWTGQSSGVTTRLYDIEFVDSNNGWAVGSSAVVLHTSDGGNNWVPQTSGVSTRLHDVCFVSPLQGWIVGYSGTILHTSDGGANWDVQTSGTVASLQGVCFSDSLRGWAVGYSGEVLYTQDGGNNWSAQNSGTGSRLFSLECIDTLRAWAGGTSSLIRTVDGGSNWVSLNENVPEKWRNVVATISGTSTPSEIYIVCGHFDSTSDDPMVRAPGADDNASGTSLVLEAASVLKDFPLLSSVKFICFSGEEQGLIGSDHFAADMYVAGESIAGVLNFDMVGYGTPSIYLYGNGTSEWLVDYCIAVRDSFVPSLGITKEINPSMRWSDHASFWDRGYSALCGIEVDYMTNPYYHTTGDTVGYLTIPFAANVTELAVASLASLAVVDTTNISVPAGVPAAPAMALGKNYPNPFNPRTHIPFTLPATRGSANYVLAIFDPAGRIVRILEEGQTGVTPLVREAVWDGTDDGGRPVASGVYLCSLRCEDESRARKIVLLR
jgi:photosystem II stability/assembly factor-like uncharacterized protein